MSAQYTQEYEPTSTGNYGQSWLSSSGDKVADVLNQDSTYISHTQNLSVVPETKAKKLYIKMILGTDELASDILSLPADPSQVTWAFLSNTTPDLTDWNNQIQKFNDMELQITDGTGEYKQSFIFAAEEISNSVAQAGFSLIANWDNSVPPNYNEARLKVDKVRKIRKYVQ